MPQLRALSTLPWNPPLLAHFNPGINLKLDSEDASLTPDLK